MLITAQTNSIFCPVYIEASFCSFLDSACPSPAPKFHRKCLRAELAETVSSLEKSTACIELLSFFPRPQLSKARALVLDLLPCPIQLIGFRQDAPQDCIAPTAISENSNPGSQSPIMYSQSILMLAPVAELTRH